MIEKEARLKVINLSRLEEIKDLRTVWPHEALDFTPWLSQDDNISLLADAVEMDITVDETESSVGDFNVDIFASETGTDRKIIIENQLEDTNHDHLGKLITYASGKSADVVIWVVKHAREEHKAAIEWLNNHTDDNVGFFLCEIKLYRIGSSEPAVKFEVVERPNDWTKEVRKSESVNETQQSRYDYWVAFEDYVFNIPAFAKNFKRRKPSTDHWMNFSIGSSACHIAVSQMLFIELPSGRRLSYVKPKMGVNKFGSESVVYEGIGGTKKWEQIESYGPKFMENIVQAISRDILAYAMRTLSHCFICGHVHDELIIECTKDVSLDAICEQMGRTPSWIPGLLLRADGYECDFYKKD